MKESKRSEGIDENTVSFTLGAVVLVIIFMLLAIKAVLNKPAHLDIVALSTLAVSLVTLVTVLAQVLLARQEINLVSEDVERNRKLFAEASRRAALYLTGGRPEFSDTPLGFNDGDYYTGHLPLMV